MSDKLTLFIAVTSAAVVLQMLILAGMYFTMRKLAARVEALSSEAESRLFPMLETIKVVQDDLKQFLATSRPNIEAVIENVKTITTGARTDFERVDATLNDILDRLRLQVIRGDEMVSRALDSVEQTTEKVQHTVLSPVRHVSAIFQGVSAGVGSLFNSQKRQRNGGPSDEMFI